MWSEHLLQGRQKLQKVVSSGAVIIKQNMTAKQFFLLPRPRKSEEDDATTQLAKPVTESLGFEVNLFISLVKRRESHSLAYAI